MASRDGVALYVRRGARVWTSGAVFRVFFAIGAAGSIGSGMRRVLGGFGGVVFGWLAATMLSIFDGSEAQTTPSCSEIPHKTA